MPLGWGSKRGRIYWALALIVTKKVKAKAFNST